ncbi:MAG: response regulator transcription factor [Planctomycetaceae bacterium]
MSAKILIAEDDRVFAEIMRFNLDRAGFQVVVAHDGQVAVDHAAAEKFDLIISDFQMPRLCGEELCRGVRLGIVNLETPIIFCTAKGYEIDTARLGRELGICKFFLKPFSPTELVETVCDTLAVPASAE